MKQLTQHEVQAISGGTPTDLAILSGGAATGSAIGATIGCILGPVGAVIGGFLGAGLGIGAASTLLP